MPNFRKAPTNPIRLSATSYVVLGMLATQRRATSYEMKKRVAASIGHVWSFPHAQLYTEPARLASAGLVEEEREGKGRNRRYYRMTPTGKAALHRWLIQPVNDQIEIRDPGLLRLFFAELLNPAELLDLANEQQRVHRDKLAVNEARAVEVNLKSQFSARFGPLRLGLLYEEMLLVFWRGIAREAEKTAGRGSKLRRSTAARQHR
jgi:PadR family transcriptional regulator AphA